MIARPWFFIPQIRLRVADLVSVFVINMGLFLFLRSFIFVLLVLTLRLVVLRLRRYVWVVLCRHFLFFLMFFEILLIFLRFSKILIFNTSRFREFFLLLRICFLCRSVLICFLWFLVDPVFLLVVIHFHVLVVLFVLRIFINLGRSLLFVITPVVEIFDYVLRVSLIEGDPDYMPFLILIIFHDQVDMDMIFP